MAVSIEDVEILKPKTDKREYRRIVLKNSLQVLLISDPDTDKCAASLNVGVGSFCDPVGLEGLAHFLEHMLFYASEKYPLEDSYLKYITEHGGSTNAFTASEMTNYFFDANTDCFEEALDRFAQFFIKPLMSADATMREIKAVDSENKMYLLSDERRMSQLQKHLSLESHPYHKFGGGNCDTLDVRPKAKGVDTRQELLKFYEDKYSANLMHLVVYSKESLDKIQSLVEDKFQEIQNSDRSRFQFSSQPCTSEHLQILVRAVPIKQGHKLRIVWPITPSIVHYKEEPCRYLDHLINHEGEGSLSYVLKKLGWATELYAGEDDRASEFSFFYVVIDLTDAGQDHMQEIIGLLFKYIQLLQQSGVCKWIFDELSAICETGFHYEDKISPIDYVVRISSNMQPTVELQQQLFSIAHGIKSQVEPSPINEVFIFLFFVCFSGHTQPSSIFSVPLNGRCLLSNISLFLSTFYSINHVGISQKFCRNHQPCHKFPCILKYYCCYKRRLAEHSSHISLNGKHYLKWSQLVRTLKKGGGKLSHLMGTGPSQDEQDSMVM